MKFFVDVVVIEFVDDGIVIFFGMFLDDGVDIVEVVVGVDNGNF